MALSEMTIRHARVTGKDYTLADNDGLILHITAQGAKLWHFRVYWEGKQKRMSLGRIECRKADTTAGKCQTWLNQLFRYALVRIAG